MNREHPVRFKCTDADLSAELEDESQFSFFESA